MGYGQGKWGSGPWGDPASGYTLTSIVVFNRIKAASISAKPFTLLKSITATASIKEVSISSHCKLFCTTILIEPLITASSITNF